MTFFLLIVMSENKQIQKNLLILNGEFNTGKYTFPLVDIDFMKSYKPFGIFSSKAIKNFKLKEWQAFQVGNEKFFILIAIYNAKTMGIVRFILFDKETGEKLFYEKKVFPKSLKIPHSILEGEAEYSSADFKLHTKYDVLKKKIDIKISITDFKELPNIKFNISANYNPDTDQSISACIPFSKTTAMYSHKGLCSATGLLNIEEEEYAFDNTNSFLIFDDHKGFYPNPMVYNWVTAAKTIDGKTLGLNLTENQSVNPDKYNENCLWENGKTHFLPAVKFSIPKDINEKWYIKDKDGNIDLCFTPIDHNPFYLNLLFLKAKYEGPLGIITGTIKTKDKTFEILEFFGMGEKKYIKG